MLGSDATLRPGRFGDVATACRLRSQSGPAAPLCPIIGGDMRVTLKTVNAELARIAPSVELVKGAGYFFFRGGEADDWIDRSVRVEAIGSLTTEEWVGEYKRLKTLNQDIAKRAKQAPPKAAPEAKPAKPVN